MQARSATKFLMTVSILAMATLSNPANARKIDFQKATFGFEFSISGLKSPKTSLHPDFGAFESKYLKEYGVAFFFDLGGVIILKPYISMLSIANASASGATDLGRLFTQSMETSGLVYGARISLAPYLSDDSRSRFYFGGGVGIANISIKRQRIFQSGAAEINTQEASGSDIVLDAHMGYEFFIVQNYSLAIEAGYRRLMVEQFSHDEGTALDGSEVAAGTTLLTEGGQNEAFNVEGMTVSLLFHLHF